MLGSRATPVSLEVSSLPEQVWLDGRAVDPHNRHTELRDRYPSRREPFFR